MSVGYPHFLVSFEDDLSYTSYDASDNIIGTGNLSLTQNSTASAVSYDAGIFGKCFRTHNKAAIEISNSLLGVSNQYSVDFFLKDINRVHTRTNTAAFRFNFSDGSMLLGFYQASSSPDGTTQGISDYGSNFINVGVNRTEWHHYAFQFNSGTCTVYVDGISKGSITHTSWNLASLFFGGNVDNVFTDIALDELRICKGLVYTENFDSPLPPSIKKLYKSSTNKVYGFNNGIFGQVVQDWSLLADNEKESVFESYGEGIPTSANYSSINENFNILVYSDTSKNYTATLNAVPTPKVILPDDLMVMTSYSHVDSAVFTYTQSGNGVIKALVTLDLENYYAYRNNEFELVSISDISTSGNTLSEINSIPEEAWHIFTEGLDGIAFAYYIAQQATTDIASIDQLQIQADGVGEWVSSVHGTDFTYKYTSNTEMSVTIINAGDYKINYPQ